MHYKLVTESHFFKISFSELMSVSWVGQIFNDKVNVFELSEISEEFVLKYLMQVASRSLHTPSWTFAGGNKSL